MQQQGVLNVKKSYVSVAWALTAVVALALLVAWGGHGASQADAQQPGVRAQGPTNVALVDVNYIFKKHARFKLLMEEMKGDVDRAQAEFKRQAEAINKDAENLANFRPGTPDYRAAEEEVVNRKSKLQGQMALQKKEFLQREAKIYYNVYQEIIQEVQYYCQANNIGLVLSFNGDPINPDNPDDVLRGINNKTVYYSKELDITGFILKRVGAPAAPAGPVGFRPAAGGVR